MSDYRDLRISIIGAGELSSLEIRLKEKNKKYSD